QINGTPLSFETDTTYFAHKQETNTFFQKQYFDNEIYINTIDDEGNYPLQVLGNSYFDGDINITGEYQINGSPLNFTVDTTYFAHKQDTNTFIQKQYFNDEILVNTTTDN